MILTKKLKVQIKSSRDISYLKSLGFNTTIGDIIELPIEKLTLGSHKLVKVKCANCRKIKEVRYQAYNKSTNNDKNKYYCNNKECVNKKRTKSNKDTYGVENVFELLEVKGKIKKTNLIKYGVENPQQNKEVKEKTKLTNLKKYGVENVFQSEEIKTKIRKTNLEKYGVEYPQQSSLIRSKYSSLHKSSKVEIELLNFIKKYYLKNIITGSKKIIKGYELDIYLPDINLAFEFNGLYWHNELNKDKNYHLNKTELCEKLGIQLIHIWEDNWEYKKSIVKSIILNKLNKTKNKIFGRKTKVKEITDNNQVKEFLENNHLQGYVASSTKIGLFYNDELVSLMTFGKKRRIMNSVGVDGVYEMYRFCNKLNFNIIGGASKLFKYFIKMYKPIEILSYADRSYSNGNLYKQLGFKFVGATSPNYFYVVNRRRKYRFGFRKSILIKDGYDPNKSEREIMLERKIYRIYNSGNLKYIFNV